MHVLPRILSATAKSVVFEARGGTQRANAIIHLKTIVTKGVDCG